MKVLWILFPEMTLCDVLKIEIFNFVWILFPDMTLGDLPGFCIRVHIITGSFALTSRIVYFCRTRILWLKRPSTFDGAPQSDAMESEIFVLNTAESAVLTLSIL